MSDKRIARPRNSAIELLRICAMVMIVLSHASVHGGFDTGAMDFSVNRFFLHGSRLGNLGVDIYVLISGYFLCQKEFRIRSLSKLLLQVWFYSVGLFLVCWLGFGCTYSLKELLAVVFPTIFAEYWFVTVYVVMLILSPCINLFIQAASRRQLEYAVAAMLVLWVVTPTFTGQTMYADRVLQFVMFYLIGAYFRKYPDNIFRKPVVRTALAVCSAVLLLSSTLVCGLLENIIPALAAKDSRFYERSSVLIVGIAVGLFAIAVYHKPFTNSTINTLGGCTFGVYLLHENPMIRGLLWTRWLNNAPYASSLWLPLRILASVVIVYLAATAIEYLRQRIFEKPILAAADRLLNWIKNRIAAVFPSGKQQAR